MTVRILAKLLLAMGSYAVLSDSHATATVWTHPASLTAPCKYPLDPRPGRPAPLPPTFRWGWFGAEHFPPTPQLHRDYNEGWREWHYRR